jgi:monofunctional glycosyltransferase
MAFLPRLSFKYWKYFLAILVITVSLYGGTVYFSIQSLPDPKSCFITQWHKVESCPSSKDYIKYKQAPTVLIRSLILAEDASFFSHQGMDWYEIKQSMKRNWQERRWARGGSTISQQLAKNLYLDKSKSLTRKIKEFFIASRLENKLSKHEIIELYLSVIEFGDSLFGLTKASKYYFNKHYSELNLLESVFLVSIIPNPKKLGSSFAEQKLSESNLWRMKTILRRLYNTKQISDKEMAYSQTLLETHSWPFPHFYPEHHDFLQIPDVSGELEEELETLSDSGFDNSHEGHDQIQNQTQDPVYDGNQSEDQIEYPSGDRGEDPSEYPSKDHGEPWESE